MRKLLMILLAVVLILGLMACGQTVEEEDDKTLMVPATRPSEPEETTPIYVRPGEDEETNEDGENEGGNSTADPTPSNPGNTDAEQPEEEEEETVTPGGDTDGDTGDGFDDEVTSNPQGSATDLSWENINSFAIKSSDMSVEQLRTLCVDFFRYAKTALWTPSQTIDYIRNKNGTEDTMIGGQLYGGLPYVGNANGNIYRLLDYMGENGVVNMEDMLGGETVFTDTAQLRYFGNQCAHGATVGWARVINSTTKFVTASMTTGNGYIPIGPYTYDTAKIKSFNDKDGYRTTDIVKANGQQVMFQSYAQLKKADGLVYYTTAGHVIMAATDAHVEYIQGTDLIDGSGSYIYIIDMAQRWESYTTADGRDYQIKNSVDAKVTFAQLFNNNYLPFTFAEFLGTDPIEDTTATFSVTGATTTLDQLFKGKVTSNYAITDAYIILYDSEGDQVYKHAVRNKSAWGKTLDMAKTGENVDFWGNLNVLQGTYTVKVEVQLGTGERPTVYTGTLSV